MKKISINKKAVKSRQPVCIWLDSHKWATKMEIRRLLSGKPGLTIETDPQKSINVCSRIYKDTTPS